MLNRLWDTPDTEIPSATSVLQVFHTLHGNQVEVVLGSHMLQIHDGVFMVLDQLLHCCQVGGNRTQIFFQVRNSRGQFVLDVSDAVNSWRSDIVGICFVVLKSYASQCSS